MPSARIRFTQVAPGPGVGGNGYALLGVVGTPVLVENVDNTGVDKAQFELLYVPPTSALTVGVKQAYSATLTWSFTPDVRECFVVMVRVKDVNGNESVDVRVFGIVESTGRLIVPVVRGEAMNFGGQAFGWQPYQRAYNKTVDTLESETRLAAVAVTDADQTLLGTTGRWFRIAPATLTAARTLTLGPAGLVANDIVEITRLDVSAFAVTIVSGGGGGIVHTMAGTFKGWAKFRFDGANFELRAFGQLPFVADATPVVFAESTYFPPITRRPRMRVDEMTFFVRPPLP